MPRERAEFERDWPRRMAAIAAMLRSGRIPHDRPRRRFLIAKSGGAKRPIEVPSLDEAIAQRAVLMQLTPIVERRLLDCSVAFRPGRDRLDALQMVGRWQAAGDVFAFHGDVASYFEGIPHTGLRRAIRPLVRERAMRRLLDEWLGSVGEVTTSRRFLRRRIDVRGLPQGAVLSPMLANVFLHQLDVRAVRAGFHYIRYADDVLITTRTERGARQAQAWLSRRVAAMGLRLAPAKCRVDTLDGATFLGVRLPLPAMRPSECGSAFVHSRFWLARRLAVRGAR